MRMRRSSSSWIPRFLGLILNFLNYLQSFVGVSMLIYSCLMLNHWRDNQQNLPPNSPPPPFAPYPSYSNNPPGSIILNPLDAISLFAFVSNIPERLQLSFHSLPKPWFIYAFMGVGVSLCCVTFVGHIAAEAINGCCLYFYALLAGLFMLLEISLVTFIAYDHQWEKDLPPETTGELDRLREFLEDHATVCKWVGIFVLTLQVCSLALSIILRALVNQKVDYDTDDEYEITGKPQEPLLHSPLNQPPRRIRGEGGGHFDIWSSRMRQKYGLHVGSSKQNLQSQNEESA